MADSTLTDVGVCNKALVGKLGAESIETITESEITTDLEAICAQAYPTVRDLCLSINDWGFAQKKQQLSEDGATVPVNLHSKAFFLPPDMKHGPDAVYFDGGSIPTTNYEIIGGHMMCDAETVIVEYTIRPDEADWPPLFHELRYRRPCGRYRHAGDGNGRKERGFTCGGLGHTV